MKRVQWFGILAMGLLIVFAVLPGAIAGEFTLSSPHLNDGGPMAKQQVFNGFGCTGSNVSPALHWDRPPAGTKSFAVTCYDPDAPTGSGWWHWVVFNLGPDVRALPENSGDPAGSAAPAGCIQSMTDFGKTGYGGACPPQGDSAHHYIFTVYALDVESLPLEASAPAAMVGFYIHQHAIDKAVITVEYSR